MDPVVKLRHNIDALFGQGVSKYIPNFVLYRLSYFYVKFKLIFRYE